MEAKAGKYEGGWTLIEVIFCLSLIGSFLLLVIPSLQWIGERAEREMVLSTLASELQLSQIEALSRQSEVALKIEGHRLIRTQSGSRPRETVISPRYELHSNFPNQTITFRRSGQVQGGTIELKKVNHVLGKIKVQVASGRPTLEWSIE